MKREFLKGLGIEDDAIKKIMAENGSDIEKAKADLESARKDLAEKEKKVTELTEQLKSFDGSNEKLEELQKKVADFEKADAERKKAEEESKANAEILERFNKVVGERKFKHEDIKNGRFNAFKTALSNAENKGKGDTEIFDNLTKDLDCFTNPQKEKIKLPQGGGSKVATDDAKIREIMGLPPLKE